MIQFMHKPYLFPDGPYKTGRGEDLQSLPKSHQLPFQLEIGDYLNAKMHAGGYGFDDLLGVMNGFGPDVGCMIMIGPEDDLYGILAYVAGDAYDRMKMRMRVKILLPAENFPGQQGYILDAIQCKGDDIAACLEHAKNKPAIAVFLEEIGVVYEVAWLAGFKGLIGQLDGGGGNNGFIKDVEPLHTGEQIVLFKVDDKRGL